MSKARQLADLGNQVDDGAITGSNMVINGAMQVAQRGVTNTYSASDTFVADRFLARGVSTSQLVITVTQEDDGPAGFNKSLKINTDTAETDLASNEQLKMEHRLEGNTVGHLAWGTSDAKTVTLSFWFKSSTTGTTAVALLNQDNNRSFVSTFTVNSANTWEYKTITVAGPTDGSWRTGTSIGIRIRWGSFGTEFHTTSTDQWANTQDMSVSGAIDWSDTANKYFQITGVCLNVGDSAIDFPHESYGDTLAKCQRYYYQVEPTAHNFGAYATNAHATQDIWFPVTMRASPSLSNDQSSSSYSSAEFVNFSLANNHVGRLLHRSTTTSINARYNGGMVLKADAEL